MVLTMSRPLVSLCPPNGVVRNKRFLMVVLSHSTGPEDSLRLSETSKKTFSRLRNDLNLTFTHIYLSTWVCTDLKKTSPRLKKQICRQTRVRARIHTPHTFYPLSYSIGVFLNGRFMKNINFTCVIDFFYHCIGAIPLLSSIRISIHLFMLYLCTVARPVVQCFLITYIKADWNITFYPWYPSLYQRMILHFRMHQTTLDVTLLNSSWSVSDTIWCFLFLNLQLFSLARGQFDRQETKSVILSFPIKPFTTSGSL